MKHFIEIKDLHAEAEDKKILKGINLKVGSGEIHAIMGPNGSGKSTLVNVFLGNPRYKITKGSISFDKKNITKLSPDKKSLIGLFATFQQPTEIPGLNFGQFLRTAKNIHLQSQKQPRINPQEFAKTAEKYMKMLNLGENFLSRELNKNFSGGEKKKSEILQMAILEPHIAFLDEIDSGLDIDSLKAVATSIKTIAKKLGIGIVLITHYQRLLNYITPDFVHIIDDGEIIKSGKKDLALEIEKNGYNSYIQ